MIVGSHSLEPYQQLNETDISLSEESPVFKVRDTMSKHLVTLRENNTVSQARQIMGEQQIRHIPIINDSGDFVGLLTQRDVLAATVSILAEVDQQTIDEMEASIPIRELMTTAVTVVHEDTDLREAATNLLELKLGCLPVLSNGRLVGILTEADFIKLTITLLDQIDPAHLNISA